MSKGFNDVASVPSREVVEEHMRRARIERSRAMWSMVSNLFSRPETDKDETDCAPVSRDVATAHRA